MSTSDSTSSGRYGEESEQSKKQPKPKFEPDPRIDTVPIELGVAICFWIFLFVQLVLTVQTFRVLISSSFKDLSELLFKERSYYWWYAMYCLFIFLTLCQTLTAVNKSEDNFDDFSCAYILTLICLIIEIIIWYSLSPVNTSRLAKEEFDRLYLYGLGRLWTAVVTFVFLVFFMVRYHQPELIARCSEIFAQCED